MPEFLQQIGVTMDFQFVAVFSGLVWVRMLAIIVMIPFLFGKPVPIPIRVGGATALALFVIPLIIPAERPPMTNDLFLLFFLYLKEIGFGLVMGITVSMIFYGFEAAGHMIDNQRGVSIARVLIPQLGTMGSISSQFLFQLAIVTYLAVGGHLYFFGSVFDSFLRLPVMEFPNVAPGWLPLLDFLLEISGEVIRLSLAISAPVIIAILVADIILGVANRVAPQINVWELGFNLKGYIGVLLLFFMMLHMAKVMEQQFAIGQGYTDRSIRLMEGRVLEGEMPAVEEGDLPPPLPWIPKKPEKLF